MKKPERELRFFIELDCWRINVGVHFAQNAMRLQEEFVAIVRCIFVCKPYVDGVFGALLNKLLDVVIVANHRAILEIPGKLMELAGIIVMLHGLGRVELIDEVSESRLWCLVLIELEQ